MSKPFFSIIIPTHNAIGRIGTALESISKQTFTDYEVILVCDACEDDTALYAKEYMDEIDRFSIIQIDEGNDGMARNKGLDVASGEWVLFLDDDDWYINDYVLEGMHKIIVENHMPFDILVTSFYVKNVGIKRPLDNNGHLFPNVWSKVWKRNFIGDTRFPKVEAVSDYEFTKLMEAKDTTIYATDFLTVFYNYMRPGSITETEARKGKENAKT